MISGSIVALVTPMDTEGKIDWSALDGLIEWHIEMGTNAIVPVGTTGESATIPMQEHCEIVKHVVNTVAGRVPVIAGTGANATQEAIELTRAAKDAGADACLLVTPYYNKPTQEGLYLHYKAIAEAVDLPQVLYNVPGRTACDMLPDTVARLAEIPQIIAIKEATGDLERTARILALCGDAMIVVSGDDATACDLMLSGARGTISVTANVAPAKMSRMCALAISGDREAAREIDTTLMGLHKNLFLESNPIPVKWALSEMGRIGRGIRLPLTELSAQYHDAVRDAMRQAGAIN
ncbi:MAG: 4-hydroxy-tetrahydrodipicolinate synthase [Proteobacteria bacterium]|jgi:4-hydroxy-tetrahydrodipicolinate synthase|nr:4-hydroxy-tetrahydrodipicolinate synthase [Pseudomonadota bacterium]MDA1301498.1 4-hydroxy-tetrahydrodipicolinate synthase [Pseudomonadota bacterium]